MKNTLFSLVVTLSLVSVSAIANEDWKGKPDTSEFSAGALTGMGIIDNHVGFAIMGTVSKKIVKQGFIPDINNNVNVEAQMGPVFMSGGTAFMFSGHLRWDFIKDEEFTLYALGGAGGNITPASLGDRFELYPRFGVGAMWDKLKAPFVLRAELSHELIAVGVTVPLFY